MFITWWRTMCNTELNVFLIKHRIQQKNSENKLSRFILFREMWKSRKTQGNYFDFKISGKTQSFLPKHGKLFSYPGKMSNLHLNFTLANNHSYSASFVVYCWYGKIFWKTTQGKLKNFFFSMLKWVLWTPTTVHTFVKKRKETDLFFL